MGKAAPLRVPWDHPWHLSCSVLKRSSSPQSASLGINRDCVNHWPLQKIPPRAPWRSHGSSHCGAREVKASTKRLLNIVTVEVCIQIHTETLKGCEFLSVAVWSLKIHSQGIPTKSFSCSLNTCCSFVKASSTPQRIYIIYLSPEVKKPHVHRGL